MYLITYGIKDKIYPGFLKGDKNGVIPAATIFAALSLPEPKDMTEAVELLSPISADKLNAAVENTSAVCTAEDITIMAPIPYPRRNIICLGKNYVDHVNEVTKLSSVGSDIPKAPIYFSKIAYPSAGPGDIIENHSDITAQLDYEVELAVIIGSKCRNVKKEDAEDHIFGYTIVNDITARDLQSVRQQWHLGKSLDTFCSMGPCIVHKSAIPMPVDLQIQSYVNGELRQNSRTSKLIFSIPEIIEDLSSGITLLPGDIIITGTPAGVGMGFAQPKYLQSGDVVECRIEKIGSLINTIS